MIGAFDAKRLRALSLHTCRVLMLALVVGAGLQPAHGQDPVNDPEPEDRQEGSAEQEDRAADIRDAINENLVTPLKDEEEKSPPTDGPVTEPGPEPELDAGMPEDEPWYRQFESTTEFAQTLPDKVPGLRGKGWLHFGRVEAEYGYFSGGALSDESGFNFRSLRGGLLRQYNDKTTLKLEIDATDGDSNWVDLWLRYQTERFGTFTVGNQRVAQTLVNQTSRLSRTFQEVPLAADAFGLGRRLGVGWDLHYKKLGGHLTAFGSDLNDNIGKFGYGARFYTNPTRARFKMMHVGISLLREKMDRDAQFRAYPETRVTDIRLVDTGRHSEVDEQSIVGLEIAGARDSWSFRSEYFLAEWDRSDLEDPRFQGYYLQANWALTGETFNYTQGKFLRIRPQGPRGAWEVAFRYSYIDLDDLEIAGGEQTNTSIALNWYGPGTQLRVQGALIHVDPDNSAGDKNSWIAQVRVQIHW